MRDKLGRFQSGTTPWNKKCKVEKICGCCHKRFFVHEGVSKIGWGKYCSIDCYNKSKKGVPSILKGRKLPKQSGHLSPHWKGGKVKKICGICQSVFYVPPSCVKKGGGKYCSHNCLSISKKELIGEKSFRFKGRIIAKTGYVYIYTRTHPFRVNTYILEHRLVMEKCIGRYLKSTEIVHHINSDKADNSIDNLILFKSQSAHSKHHAQLKKSKR